MKTQYDLIVIGGGHAGIEAALAPARMGHRTLLITLSVDRIGHMPCNPAVGGLAKGHLVKELDALGGEIGYATDRAGIQFRMLNRAKGPAVWSPRAQTDKRLYRTLMRETLFSQENLEVVEGEVEEIRVEHNTFAGVRLATGQTIGARACVLTAGTFLRGLMHTGSVTSRGGREGEPAATRLSDNLRAMGFRLGRLKTGTPPRIFKDSIDLSQFEPQPGDDPPTPFSFRTRAITRPQELCYLTHTTPRAHGVIRANLDRSPLFSGVIEGKGPRYCPSIEDKVVRFPDKTRHQIFIEPEGLSHPELYLNGVSTSLPADVQLDLLQAIPGFESVRIARPGYAVEYDFLPPDQIKRTMESKYVNDLYFAGQVNGTSGYEEAAAQGFMAGVNVALKLRGEAPFVLGRDQAYIGVMLDELTTKEIDEPYRMFTSRAEFRLLLRQDNADERLMEHGCRFGLVDDRELERVRRRVNRVAAFVDLLERTTFPATAGNALFASSGLETVHKRTTLGQVLKRPSVKFSHVRSLLETATNMDEDEERLVETEIKYKGYIARQERDVRAMRALEAKRIPESFSYDDVAGLSTESREKLLKRRPETLGHASRIAGVRAADLSVLAVYLERDRKAAEKPHNAFNDNQLRDSATMSVKCCRGAESRQGNEREQTG